MHEKVEKYLAGQAEKAEEKRQKHLIELGLWEKEFGEFEWGGEYDEETGKTYRKKAIPVTDEEYGLIEKAQPEKRITSNPIAVTCTVLAYVVFVIGFVAGIVMGNSADIYGNGFTFMTAAAVWVNAFFIGFFFLVYAQIIRLLQRIANQTGSKK